MKKIFTLILSSVFCVLNSLGQTSIPLTIGVPYLQDFNTLPSAGNQNWVDTVSLGGWYSDENNIYADDGNDVFGGWLHSYGSTNSNERALGSKSFSSLSGVAFAVRMKNNSNNPINYFQISFTGEQWRQNANSVTQKFYYQLNAPDITNGTWTPVPQLYFSPLHVGTALALDGNLAANDTSFLIALPLVVNAGQQVWFKWELIGNSSSPGLAIDDLSITPYATNPTSAATLENESTNISVYPSLTDGFVFIHSEKIQPSAVVCVYDALGRKIYSENIPHEWNETKLDLNSCTKGTYTVIVLSSEMRVTQKIILK